MEVIVMFIFFGLSFNVIRIDSIDLDNANLATDQLIRKYKYPTEKHYVTTEDGYILLMHRIPNPGKRPFMLQHGLQASSSAFVMRGPDKALGYYLYELGYDVWLGNFRGNHYTRNHSHLDPDIDESFWNFSWHEMGIYDLPAMIDYILNRTNYKKLLYAGHSQGSTSFFVMCSELPEYNAKIDLMHALAPVAYMKHIRTPLRDFIANTFSHPVSYKFHEMGRQSETLQSLCFQSHQTQMLCAEGLFLLMGRNYEQFDMSLFPVLLTHIPDGISTNQIRHYSQLYKSNKFCQFDHGMEANLNKYGTPIPPNYQLKNCAAPIVLHYSQNDYLANPVDVNRLAKELPNVVMKNTNLPPKWNHLDYLWATDGRKLLYKQLVKITKDRGL